MAQIGAALIGGASSLLGGLIGSSGASSAARAQIQAAERQRDFQQSSYDSGLMNRLALFVGPEQALAMSRGLLGERFNDLWGTDAADPSFTPEQQRRYAELQANLARPVVSGTTTNPIFRAVSRNNGSITPEQKAAYQGELDALWSQAGGRVGKAGTVNREAFMGMGPGVVTKMQDAGRTFERESGRALARVRNQNRRLTAETDLWGSEREGVLRTDAARALSDANDASTAEAIAQGLGNSSVAIQARAGNRQRSQESLQRALADLNEQRTDRRVAVRQYGDARDASLTQANIASAYQNELAPLQMLSSLYSGPDVSPWLSRDVTNLFPSASPSASFAVNAGNTLAQMGSTMLFANAGSPSGGNDSIEEMRRIAQERGGMPPG